MDCDRPSQADLLPGYRGGAVIVGEGPSVVFLYEFVDGVGQGPAPSEDAFIHAGGVLEDQEGSPAVSVSCYLHI